MRFGRDRFGDADTWTLVVAWALAGVAIAGIVWALATAG